MDNSIPSNYRFWRNLSNYVEQINEPPLRRSSTTSANSCTGEYFKLYKNNNGITEKKFVNVDEQLKVMNSFSEESTQDNASSGYPIDLNPNVQSSRTNMDNYYKPNNHTNIFEEPRVDALCYGSPDAYIATQGIFSQTKQNGENCTILTKNESEKLKEKISILHSKCSNLKNVLREDEINELISYLGDNSTVEDLRHLWWQLRWTERVYFFNVMNELKRFYDFLIKYFKIKENGNTETIWKLLSFRKLLYDLASHEKDYNENFYKLINSKSIKTDEIKNLINESRYSLRKFRTKLFDFYTNKFIEEIRYEYCLQFKNIREYVPFESNKNIIWIYQELEKKEMSNIGNVDIFSLYLK